MKTHSKKTILVLVFSSILFGPTTKMLAAAPAPVDATLKRQIDEQIEKTAKVIATNLRSLKTYNITVGCGEAVDALTRGLKILNLTQPSEEKIKFWGIANLATSLFIVAAKLAIGSNDGYSVTRRFCLSLPNICDSLQSRNIIRSAKTIAKNNKKRKPDQSLTQGILLLLLAIEEGISAKHRFDLTNWNAYKTYTKPDMTQEQAERQQKNGIKRQLRKQSHKQSLHPFTYFMEDWTNVMEECEKRRCEKQNEIGEHIASYGASFVWLIRFITEAVFINNLKNPVLGTSSNSSTSYHHSNTYNYNDYTTPDDINDLDDIDGNLDDDNDFDDDYYDDDDYF